MRERRIFRLLSSACLNVPGVINWKGCYPDGSKEKLKLLAIHYTYTCQTPIYICNIYNTYMYIHVYTRMHDVFEICIRT